MLRDGIKYQKIRYTALAFCQIFLFACAGLGAQVVTSSQSAPSTAASARALVIGIDEYRGPGSDPEILEKRGLGNLEGALRDAETMAAELEQRGYAVLLLRNREATRANILGALETHLEEGARRGDDLVFYFAGHGSRLESGDPAEPDGRDETLVPADAGAGAPDLLDGELRRRLGRLLDRGASLTVILDACHSGSGVRGLPTGRARAAKPAPPRAKGYGRERQPPSLEEGDALILAAAQDSQRALEVVDTRGDARGAFTYALLRALGAATPGESAATTFRRASSLIVADALEQHPVLAGAADRQRAPLLAPAASEASSRGAATTQAVVLEDKKGRIVLEGGWTRGLRRGDELVAGETLVQLVDVDPVRSRGQRLSGPKLEPSASLRRVRSGPLVEPDLRVFMPEAELSSADLLDLSRRVGALVAERGVTLVRDPWRAEATHVLRFTGDQWQLVDLTGAEISLGPLLTEALLATRLDELPPRAALLLQLPLPRGSADSIELGIGSRHDAIELVKAPAAAHYQLVGHQAEEGLVYAWARAGVVFEEAGESPLPSHTREVSYTDAERASEELVSLARKLARLRFWLRLESPKEDFFGGYRLALLSETRRVVGDPVPPALTLEDSFGIALWSDNPYEVDPRFLYVLLLDANGRQHLLYPHPLYGSVENRYPLEEQAWEALIPFGPEHLLRITEPAGLETYILLTTDKPIPDPMVLDHSGVRAPKDGDHPLARLILESQRGRRSRAAFPTQWSIDRLTVRVRG